MSAVAHSRERLVLERLKDTYEQQGYEFFLYPPPELVPPFLGNYRPDALALKPGEGIIIEVKSSRGPDPRVQLGQIAKAVSGQKGWEFRVLLDEPRPDELTRILPANSDEIVAQIGDVESLASAGQYRAAFMLAWAVLEAVARGVELNQGISTERPFSPLQTLQSLELSGLLDSDTAGVLREKAKLRNKLVHGDFSADIDHESVALLVAQLRKLTLGLSGAPAEPAPRRQAPA